MILLDTHTLIWWIKNSPKLSQKAKDAILESKKDSSIYVSSISIWEICMLFKNGEIEFGTSLEEWIYNLEKMTEISFVSIDNEIAKNTVFLPDLEHKDPADRFIVATALSLGCPIATKDKKIHAYKSVQSVW